MIEIEVTFSCGNKIKTRFNGTKEEADLYYMGQLFNISGDEMSHGISVKVLG